MQNKLCIDIFVQFGRGKKQCFLRTCKFQTSSFKIIRVYEKKYPKQTYRIRNPNCQDTWLFTKRGGIEFGTAVYNSPNDREGGYLELLSRNDKSNTFTKSPRLPPQDDRTYLRFL